MTTPARELRDALAEALREATYGKRNVVPWSKAKHYEVGHWHIKADDLLASLPSVKLKMGWEE